jgi:hypothetical protein
MSSANRTTITSPVARVRRHCWTHSGLDVNYQDADDSDYAGWLGRLATWLAELYRVARHASGRLCLNVPLDRDRGGWQPVSADAINVARTAAGTSAPGCSGTNSRPERAQIGAVSIPRGLPT